MTIALALAKRHPLVAFFALTYLISWLPLLFGGSNFPFGPVIATLIVVVLIGGKTELKAWWGRVSRWRGEIGWYALAILLPFAINGAAAVLAVLLGAPFPTAAAIARWPELFITFPLYLIALGPLGEEPGWRGFAMPRLEPGRSALAASLVLGILVAAWHLPLVVTGRLPVVNLLAILAAQIVYTWLANRTNGSVLLVMLTHAAQGGLGGEYFGPMFSGAGRGLKPDCWWRSSAWWRWGSCCWPGQIWGAGIRWQGWGLCAQLSNWRSSNEHSKGGGHCAQQVSATLEYRQNDRAISILRSIGGRYGVAQ